MHDIISPQCLYCARALSVTNDLDALTTVIDVQQRYDLTTAKRKRTFVVS